MTSRASNWLDLRLRRSTLTGRFMEPKPVAPPPRDQCHKVGRLSMVDTLEDALVAAESRRSAARFAEQRPPDSQYRLVHLGPPTRFTAGPWTLNRKYDGDTGHVPGRGPAAGDTTA
jgi:hypothetical protein